MNIVDAVRQEFARSPLATCGAVLSAAAVPIAAFGSKSARAVSNAPTDDPIGNPAIFYVAAIFVCTAMSAAFFARLVANQSKFAGYFSSIAFACGAVLTSGWFANAWGFALSTAGPDQEGTPVRALIIWGTASVFVATNGESTMRSLVKTFFYKGTDKQNTDRHSGDLKDDHSDLFIVSAIPLVWIAAFYNGSDWAMKLLSY